MNTLLTTLLQPVTRRAGEHMASALLGEPRAASEPTSRASSSALLLPALQPRAELGAGAVAPVELGAVAPPAASVAAAPAAPAARPPLVQLLSDHWPLLVVAGLVVGTGILLWRYWEPGAVASREARRMAELDRADRLLRRGSPPPITVPSRRRRRIADGSVA